MNMVSVLLIFSSFSYLVVGDHTEFIRSTYETYTEIIGQVFSDYEQYGVKDGDGDLCTSLSNFIAEVKEHGSSDKITITSEIKRGAFNGNEGFDLILQDMSKIHIPAIIQCTTKYKVNNTDLVIEAKQFLYFYVVYITDRNFNFIRAVLHDESSDSKTTFILCGAITTQIYMRTYSNTTSNAKLLVRSWFKNAKRFKQVAKNECILKLTPVGLTLDDPGAEWEIINGEAVTGKYYLRIARDTEVQLIGIIKCTVKVTNSSSDGIKVKYFTAANDKGTLYFGNLYGPINIAGKETFAMDGDVYNMIKEEQHVTQPK